MAISFVAAGAVQTGSNPTIPVPTGYAAGDLLIIFVAVNTAPTTPSGWTVIQNATGSVTCYYKFAGASESSVSLTFTGTAAQSVMVAYRGVSAYDSQSTVVALGTVTSVATTSLTTTAANDFVISFYDSTGSTGGTWGVPSGTTSRVLTNPTATIRGILIVDELQAAAGSSATRTATCSASGTLYAFSFSIKPTVATANSGFFFMF